MKTRWNDHVQYSKKPKRTLEETKITGNKIRFNNSFRLRYRNLIINFELLAIYDLKSYTLSPIVSYYGRWQVKNKVEAPRTSFQFSRAIAGEEVASSSAESVGLEFIIY